MVLKLYLLFDLPIKIFTKISKQFMNYFKKCSLDNKNNLKQIMLIMCETPSKIKLKKEIVVVDKN